MNNIFKKITIYLILASVVCPRSWAMDGMCLEGGIGADGLPESNLCPGTDPFGTFDGDNGQSQNAPSGSGVGGGGYIDQGDTGVGGSGSSEQGHYTDAEYEKRAADSNGQFSSRYLDKGFGLIYKEWPNHSYDSEYNKEIWSRNDSQSRSIKPSTDIETKKYRSLLGTRRIVGGWAHPSEVTQNLQLYYHWVVSYRQDFAARAFEDSCKEQRRKNAEIHEKWRKDRLEEYEIRCAEESRIRAERLEVELLERQRLKAEQDERSRIDSLEFLEKREERRAVQIIADAAKSARAEEFYRTGLESIRKKENERLVAYEAHQNKPSVRAFAALCFTGDTLVNTGDGETKPIQDLQVGDWVQTCDLQSMSCESRRVTNVFHSLSNRLLRLSAKGKVIRTTENHPFYVVNLADWREASQLKRGDQLLASSRNLVKLDAITEELGNFDVYNIETEGDHNYYASDILVHNCTLGTSIVGGATAVAEGAAIGGLGLAIVSVAATKYVYDRLAPIFAKSEAVVQSGVTEPSETEDESEDLAETEIRSKDLKEAERALTQDKNFRRWFHREYKADQGGSKGDRTNPDMSPEEVYEAYQEWKSLGKPKRN
jgi:hypothetical protein